MTSREILTDIIGRLDDARNQAEIDSFEANREVVAAICAGKSMALTGAIEIVGSYLQNLHILEEVEE